MNLPAGFFQKPFPDRIDNEGRNIIMGTGNRIEQELMNYISDHKIINTHPHHLPEQVMADFGLDKLLY